ncbi:hypothetical protein [Shimazuella alba]|uniref:Uncharacterized protein n=1 Tax=Shimazuella alba TaxID=2690964 RepID=A0A6I4VNQ4_9BACL|nr:hypothetical protein [Shimazuella alba]MXQ52663.1 hypothetical protein [Shimazuella alba]
MNQPEWKKFGKLVLLVSAFGLGQLLVWKLLATVKVVITVNDYAIDLTGTLHLLESVLIYSAIIYVILKKLKYWDILFRAGDLMKKKRKRISK